MALPLLFSHSVVSDSLQPHGLQHTRLPCPSLSPRVCSNLSRWCHPTILSSGVPFSSCPQSFSTSGSFPVSWLFTSGGQRWPCVAVKQGFTAVCVEQPHRNISVSELKRDCANCRDMGGSRACHTEWSKSERKTSYISAHMENLEK